MSNNILNRSSRLQTNITVNSAAYPIQGVMI